MDQNSLSEELARLSNLFNEWTRKGERYVYDSKENQEARKS
jgi:hypothetical protein